MKWLTDDLTSMYGDLHTSSSGQEYMKYSKAIDTGGQCKNPELLTLTKHDFSTLVCVTAETHHELITRGWAPLPN